GGENGSSSPKEKLEARTKRFGVQGSDSDAKDTTQSPKPRSMTRTSASWSAPQLKRGPTPWNDVLRLPREGPKAGGGKMEILDSGALEALKADAAREQAEAEALLGTRKKDRTRRRPRQAASASADVSMSPTITVQGADGESIVLPPRRAEHLDGPEARRRVEMQMKFNKVELARQADQKFIRERAEKAKTMREDRFKRLVDAVCDHGGLAMECAENLASFEKRYQQRRWDLYSEWDEHVAHPLAQQAFNYLNPADRFAQQKLCGLKTVSWKLPNEKPQLKLNIAKDPVRRELVEGEFEEAFDEVCRLIASG
ncbi:unnamed protein product, partial [Durusdinium trenchii]